MKKFKKTNKTKTRIPQHVKDLKYLGLIKNKNLFIFKKGCRDDKSINVVIDKKSKLIFLDKTVTKNEYYKDKITVKKVQVGKKYNTLPTIEHSKENLKRIKKVIKNKIVCDFGSGYGANFDFLKNYSKQIYGVEVSKIGTAITKKNFPEIILNEKIDDYDIKFDVVTMFHVFAHLSDPLKKLKEINKKLNKGGKLIIETLHAEDWISTVLKDESYNNFRFSKEFLLLHTENSMKKFLLSANFKKVKVFHYQRYGYTNFLGWMLDNKPGGHIKYLQYHEESIDKRYKKKLELLKKSDTLFIVATK